MGNKTIDHVESFAYHGNTICTASGCSEDVKSRKVEA